jgi:hypothetical protein
MVKPEIKVEEFEKPTSDPKKPRKFVARAFVQQGTHDYYSGVCTVYENLGDDNYSRIDNYEVQLSGLEEAVIETNLHGTTRVQLGPWVISRVIAYAKQQVLADAPVMARPNVRPATANDYIADHSKDKS